MRNKIYIIPLFLFFLSIYVIPGKDAQAQTEGFDVKTPTQKIADDSENFVKEIINDTEHNHEDALPKDIICESKCLVVLPKVNAVNEQNDFKGTGLLSCLKTNSDELTPPIIYEINGLTSFYENGGGIIVFVTDDSGVKSLLVNSLGLTSDNSQAGSVGFNNETKPAKSYITYSKPTGQNVEGADLSGSSLVYASTDTFTAYQKTMVPIDILLYNQDIPPALRGFNTAVTELRAVCK